MKRNLLFFSICSLVGIVNSLYAQDSLILKKRNIIYLMPTSVFGNVPDLNVAWFFIGYDYRLNKKCFVGGCIGAIVYTNPKGGSFLLGDATNKSSGFNLNLQDKIILKTMKPYYGTNTSFYYSTSFFYQFTKTFRSEIYSHQYNVNRNMFALTPEIGFMFINKHHLYTDIGIGLGIKYFTSKTYGKLTPLSSNDVEMFTGKTFEYGSEFQPRILVQYKIGYNF